MARLPPFLSACKCGRRLPVTAAQAGDQLQCECGQRIEVPTLRHLAALERVEEAARRRAKNWGMRQGLSFSGLRSSRSRPSACLSCNWKSRSESTSSLFKRTSKTMSPADVWRAWPILEHGIRRSLYPRRSVGHGAKSDRYPHLGAIAGSRRSSSASIGVLLVAIGLFIVRPPRRRTSVCLAHEGFPMKAAYIKEVGPPENIIYGELPTPQPAARRRWSRCGPSMSIRSILYIRAGNGGHADPDSLHRRLRSGGRRRGGRSRGAAIQAGRSRLVLESRPARPAGDVRRICGRR